MERILKQYTIVPDTLYVERGADRQLNEILVDMQRPGYILVSRQMGKTNLLLNAKRRLENENDVFVYIDLSNQFNNERDCFENIINVATDTHEGILLEAKKEIIELRRNISKSFQLEHFDELRILLKHIKGKLVIILDEIDALTKTTYSDNIFAQIRSVYFNRMNYPILNKLTYILSGVVEPSEIIKDPKISPFNIGQKIFLNDFSYSEFINFLEKARIKDKLDQEIIDRIYYWTKGNPRMTWDVCYDIECLNEASIKLSDIDTIVSEIYLTSFDKPPIDNIRELVKNDRELRDALIQLHYNKGNELSDKIKSKLYLAGITNYEEKSVVIKNEIVRRSLSLDWLRKIEEEDKGLITIALEFQDKGEYKNSLDTFERYLSNNKFEPKGKSLYYYYMGYAAFRLSNFEKSLTYLYLVTFDRVKERDWYYRSLNLKALASLYLNKIDESVKYYKEIIDQKNLDEIYYRASLNYAGILSLNVENNNYSEVENIYNEIIRIRENEIEDVSENFIFEIKSVAYFSLAKIQSDQGLFSEALNNFSLAILLANERTKPTILLSKYNIVSAESKENTLHEIFDILKLFKTPPVSKDPDKPMEFDLERFIEFAFIAYTYHQELFESIKPLLKWISNNYGESLISLLNYGLNLNENLDGVLNILDDLYNNIENSNYDVEKKLSYTVYQLKAFFTKSPVYCIKYIDVIKDDKLLQISYLDFEIFTVTIRYYIENKNFDEALNYIYIIELFKKNVNKADLINYLLIDHYKSVVYYNRNKSYAVEISKTVLNQLDNLDKNIANVNGLISRNLIGLKNVATKIINSQNTTNTVPIIKKYGRNEIVEVKYKGTNKTIKEKFKNVESDIQKGKCIIV